MKRTQRLVLWCGGVSTEDVAIVLARIIFHTCARARVCVHVRARVDMCMRVVLNNLRMYCIRAIAIKYVCFVQPDVFKTKTCSNGSA